MNVYMKTIVVATDFSSCALNAAGYAADMALAVGADMLLLHVYYMPAIYSEIPVAFSEEEMKKSFRIMDAVHQ